MNPNPPDEDAIPTEDAPTDPGVPMSSFERDRINLLAQAREGPDPVEETRGMPLLLGLLTGAVLVWGAWYLAAYGDFGLAGSFGDARSPTAFLPPADRGAGDAGGLAEASGPADGEAVYQRVCVACHQASGLGVSGAFPPLDGSEWVAMDARIPSAIVVHGLMGEIVVKGETYNGAMPAFGAQLSDEEVAAVVTYVRGAWGNASPPITIEDVQAARGLADGPIAGGAGLEALLDEGG